MAERRGPPEPPAEAERQLRHQVKGELRRRMRSVRSQLPSEARQRRSRAVAERVVALEAFRRATTVLSFMPVRAETDPAPIVEAARTAGKEIALPRVDFEAGALRLHRWAAGDALHEGAWGIPEPDPGSPEVPEAQVDLVLVPALAVDPRGHRIGYGKGFYDQLLPTLPNATRCALVYDFQILSELPHTEGDVPVHVIASDSQVIMVPTSHTG